VENLLGDKSVALSWALQLAADEGGEPAAWPFHPYDLAAPTLDLDGDERLLSHDKLIGLVAHASAHSEAAHKLHEALPSVSLHPHLAGWLGAIDAYPSGEYPHFLVFVGDHCANSQVVTWEARRAWGPAGGPVSAAPNQHQYGARLWLVRPSTGRCGLHAKGHSGPHPGW
jgi:hypothetical protein